MSLIFYPGQPEHLLLSPLGLVGVFVERKTNSIRDEIAGAAGDYYASAPTLSTDIEGDVSVQMDGSTGVITITPGNTGHKWNRLIDMARNGTWRRRPEVILQNNRF